MEGFEEEMIESIFLLSKKDYRKYYGNRLTFTKEKPKSLQELATHMAEMDTVDIK